MPAKKSILGFFRGSEIRFANLRAPKPRLHALFAYWQERLKHACKKNPSVDFFWIAEAKGFCMLLTRPPWLDIPWQERNTAPEPIKESIPPKKTHLFAKMGFLGASP